MNTKIRRSLTLVEMIIAIVLVLAVGAMIVPTMLNSMDERTFESAADVTNEQLLMARAHAQATGSPVEVTYRADTSQVQARFFMPWLLGLQADGSPFGGAADADDRDSQPGRDSGADHGASDHSDVITESWACRNLGRNIRIVSRSPVQSDDAAELPLADLEDDDYQTLEDLARGQEVRLAVFMPDGSALMGGPVWLNDNDGRCGLLTINPWSGMPLFERLQDIVNGDSSPKANQPLADTPGEVVDEYFADGESPETTSGRSGSGWPLERDESIGSQ